LSTESVRPTSLAVSVPAFVTARVTDSLSPGDSDCSSGVVIRSRGAGRTTSEAFTTSVLVRSAAVRFGSTRAVYEYVTSKGTRYVPGGSRPTATRNSMGSETPDGTVPTGTRPVRKASSSARRSGNRSVRGRTETL
jgi:hypothetical protein